MVVGGAWEDGYTWSELARWTVRRALWWLGRCSGRATVMMSPVTRVLLSAVEAGESMVERGSERGAREWVIAAMPRTATMPTMARPRRARSPPKLLVDANLPSLIS